MNVVRGERPACWKLAISAIVMLLAFGPLGTGAASAGQSSAERTDTAGGCEGERVDTKSIRSIPIAELNRHRPQSGQAASQQSPAPEASRPEREAELTAEVVTWLTDVPVPDDAPEIGELRSFFDEDRGELCTEVVPADGVNANAFLFHVRCGTDTTQCGPTAAELLKVDTGLGSAAYVEIGEGQVGPSRMRALPGTCQRAIGLIFDVDVEAAPEQQVKLVGLVISDPLIEPGHEVPAFCRASEPPAAE